MGALILRYLLLRRDSAGGIQEHLQSIDMITPSVAVVSLSMIHQTVNVSPLLQGQYMLSRYQNRQWIVVHPVS